MGPKGSEVAISDALGRFGEKGSGGDDVDPGHRIDDLGVFAGLGDKLGQVRASLLDLGIDQAELREQDLDTADRRLGPSRQEFEARSTEESEDGIGLLRALATLREDRLDLLDLQAAGLGLDDAEFEKVPEEGFVGT